VTLPPLTMSTCDVASPSSNKSAGRKFSPCIPLEIPLSCAKKSNILAAICQRGARSLCWLAQVSDTLAKQGNEPCVMTRR
jgi:hypothetical protein